MIELVALLLKLFDRAFPDTRTRLAERITRELTKIKERRARRTTPD